MLFAVLFIDKPGQGALRAAHLAAHIAWVDACLKAGGSFLYLWFATKCGCIALEQGAREPSGLDLNPRAAPFSKSASQRLYRHLETLCQSPRLTQVKPTLSGKHRRNNTLRPYFWQVALAQAMLLH